MLNPPRNVSLKISAPTRNHLECFFGEVVPDEILAALVGALDDAEVELVPRGEGFVSSAKHKYLIEQTRIRGGNENSGLFLTNEFFQLASDAPHGTGTISFARQVMAAKELNFAFIRTYAEGSIADPDGFIGYYVWARCGFNAPLEEKELATLPKEFAGCENLNDLMLRGGHNWWRQNGSARDMNFCCRRNYPWRFYVITCWKTGWKQTYDSKTISETD